jgi:uncharacterized tellurite resistance protein B-like protein
MEEAMEAMVAVMEKESDVALEEAMEAMEAMVAVMEKESDVDLEAAMEVMVKEVMEADMVAVQEEAMEVDMAANGEISCQKAKLDHLISKLTNYTTTTKYLIIELPLIHLFSRKKIF